MTSYANTVHEVAVAANLLCDLCALGESMETLAEARERGDGSMLETAAVINSLALVGFSTAEIGSLVSGETSLTLSTLKTLELLPRVANVPLQLMIQGKQMVEGENIGLRNIIRLVEKGVVGPVTDVVRTAISEEAYYEQHFLDMTPEQLKKARRPIYGTSSDGDGTSTDIVGYKPVDLEECRATLARLHMHFNEATIVRVATQKGVAEYVVSDFGRPTLERLAAFFGRFYPAAEGPVAAAGDAAVGPVAAAGAAIHDIAEDPIADDPAAAAGVAEGPAVGAAAHAVPHEEKQLDLDLIHYPNIPLPLHGDQVFRQYICPITQAPIRDPVRDPTNGMTLYERTAIVAWLQQDRDNPQSPMTRLPLQVEQLQEVPLVRNIINSRLLEYQERLTHFIEELAEEPAGQ